MAERRVQYQTLDHKADSGFSLTAPSLERLYIDAALALTDQLVKLDLLTDTEKRTVAVSADNKEALLVKWLNEILCVLEKDKFLCRRIVFQGFDGKKIQASLFGQTYDPLRHGFLSEIKAATYHQLEISYREQPDPHFYLKVFLDL